MSINSSQQLKPSVEDGAKGPSIEKDEDSTISTGLHKAKSMASYMSKKADPRYWVPRLFIRLGGFFVLSGYILSGAFLMQYLESEHEQKEISEILKARDELLGRLWNDSRPENTTYGEWIGPASEEMKIYEDKLYKSFDHGVTPAKEVWRLSSSIMFCITVITTVGYGHITPVTTWGRIATILYGLVGIPLLLLVLSDLGYLAALPTKYIVYLLAKVNQVRKAKIQPMFGKLNLGVYSVEVNQGSSSKEESDSYNVMKNRPESRVSTGDFALPDVASKGTQTRCDIVETDESQPIKKVKVKDAEVPLTVVIFVFFSYNCIGAYIFSQMEEGWSFFDGFYFAFITVSTIGFGDLVPGETSGNIIEENLNLIVGALYMFFGIAVISACFAMSQTTLYNYGMYIAIKLHLRKKPEEKK
ncbi:potassium channel subfamily K member 9-like [Anneissia japonica]|uniref:potassium channel subfamily K member 9-like n=1 Tax=Anneissia japonica TaxID=1529436 RepID=UPI001425B6E1|nr:potassium channel subfamily K member 9-like [Anneissia japonica]